MKTRTDLLNFLAEKYNLTRYLEIGLQRAEQNFDKIRCEYKVSVDPDPNAHATFCMTSDEFFKTNKYFAPFDLVLIDGLHHADQVKKDFENSLQVLSPNGFIVIHDCNPLKEEHTIVPRPTKSGHWHGDVYKYAIHIDVKHTVDIDCGCLVYRNMGFNPTGGYDDLAGWKDIDWDYFDQNRKELLNLVSWDEFIKL